MARMRFTRSYNFDSATRQLDSRDLDEAGDPTTDMGAAMEALLSQYGALDLQPAYPGLDIMEGSISGPLSQLGDDFGTLAARGPKHFAGSGSPEGVITATIGSQYSRTDGGADTSFYVKESGTGNTGWVAK